MTDIVETESESEWHRDAGGDARASFAILEDRGRALFVRVNRAGGGSVPVSITREALEDHFEAGPGEEDLARAYLAHQQRINAKIAELDPAGDVYTDSFPLLLATNDFE